jgi:P2 family phage contractile tail tube protein
MLPKVLKNFTCFVDGIGYAGRVDEITLPKITFKTEEHRAGGMDAPMQIDMGMEKLEASLTFAEYSPELFAMLGLMEGNKTNIVLRGAVQGDDTAVVPVVITLQGGFKETDMGSWKTGSKGTLKAQIAARYYKLEIGGVEIIEIDVENMVRVISGVDQTAAQRAALGF